jgi:DNA-binding NtrC family response regulator
VIERAVLMADGDVLEARHLMPKARAAAPEDAATTRLDEAEQSLIRRVLEECGGNVSEAARRLGVCRELLRYRMRKHRLR